MADDKPALRISPTAPLTHHELIIDFLHGEPNHDFVVRIDGPIAQPYYATLKTDPFGSAQLIWRTAQPGDYDIVVETVGAQTGWEGSFTVDEQAGLRDLRGDDEEPNLGVSSSVEPPSVMEPENPDTLSLEAKVARGDADPEDLGQVDTEYLDAAGETAEPVENATVSPEGADSDEDLEDLTVEELKDRLRDAGKPTSGNKAELIQRLKEGE